VDFAVDERDELQHTLSALYEYERDLSTKVLHRNRLNLFHLVMTELIADGVIQRFGSALDIGCNAGAYCRIISDFGFRSVLGVDIARRPVDRALAAFGATPGVRFEVGDATELALSDRYDLILCTEVIEHTTDPRGVIEKIKRGLAPGGVAVVSLPNAMSLPYALQYPRYAVRRRALPDALVEHLRFPSYRSLRLFRGPGVRVVTTAGSNLVLNSVTIRALHGTPLFRPVNRVNFRLARRWPLKYLSQFFFIVVQRTTP
jgi:2-polyprenyl-3-methyl-5-hydroxy-6-metoxy-1,4-benzoquinol methylase